MTSVQLSQLRRSITRYLIILFIFFFHEKAGPTVMTSAHVSQTRTALLKLYLIIGISLDEHLLHSRRPQCRQWCFLVVIPNLVQHSSQTSPSPHFGSWLNESNNLISRVFVATWQLNIETPF